MIKNRGASKIFFRKRAQKGLKPSDSVEFTGKPTVLELALSKKLPLEHSCGGMGTCGTCRVIVCSDLAQLPERNEVELEIARDRDFAPQERLACQLEAYDGLTVELPPKTQSPE
jgi:ferredoxin